ncbi:MAG: hypothetical protein S4CHLAM7_07880 [Chlamydiae bacterium]|nr:hypothetical protein [Chlamydiota bacterium]
MTIEDPVSDESMQLITAQIFIGHSVLAAYKSGIFRVLLKGPLEVKK